jgi:hypothetical protein
MRQQWATLKYARSTQLFWSFQHTVNAKFLLCHTCFRQASTNKKKLLFTRLAKHKFKFKSVFKHGIFFMRKSLLPRRGKQKNWELSPEEITSWNQVGEEWQVSEHRRPFPQQGQRQTCANHAIRTFCPSQLPLPLSLYFTLFCYF